VKPRSPTRTVPAVGAVALAAAGLLPALAALAWPAGGWVWFAAVVAGAAALAWNRGRLASAGDLGVTRELDDRMHIGVASTVSLRVRNRLDRPVRVQVRDVPPAAMGDGDLGGAVWLAAGEQRSFDYAVRPCDRGAWPFSEVWVRWWSPGRMWMRRHRYTVESTASVYPDIRALTDVNPLMLRKLYSELGIKEQRRRGSGTEFDHIKEHTPDDGTQGIDWKATARRCKPMVRQYRIEQNHEVVIGVDTGRLMGSRVQGIAKLDHAINASLLLSRVCLVNGDRPGVMTFNSRVQSFVRPAGDPRQMERLLRSLHDLRSDYSETAFRRALVYLETHQRKRSLVVLLTDFVHGQADEQLLQGVVGLSRRHLVLFVALRDPFVDELATAMPRRVDDVYPKVVAQGLDEDRRVVMRTLGGRGVHTLDLPPAQVTQQVLNRYLALRGGIG
jgi:uncharacterized protein (DUF58 family)